MDYYYDVMLNFGEYYFMFYEWDKDDTIEYIKKIPLKHVSNKIIIDMLNNKIKVNNEFLNKIKDKTKLKDNKILRYCCIFSDGKTSLALEFNDSGESICKSSILLDDEININEFMYNIKETNIEYEIINKDDYFNETRQERKIKNLIKMEIETLYQKHNDSKLKYIYLEWFNKLEEERDIMYKNMLNKLNDSLTNREYKIYELIKLSYNNV